MANRFWVGGTGNWSDDTNHWATTSGGSAGVGNKPSTADIAIFDGSSGGGTVTVDEAVPVAGVDLRSGYTGTVNQGAQTVTIDGDDFIVAAGTWDGQTGTLDIDASSSSTGNFLISGGTFTVPSTSMTVEADFSITGGTFNNTNTITFDGAVVNAQGTITFAGTVPGTVAISKTGGSSGLTVASGTTIDLGTSPTSVINGSNNVTNEGTILVAGTWTITSTNQLINNGTITHSGTGWTSEGSIVNNVGATITYSGTAMSLERNFTQDGTFDTTGITITFNGAQAIDDTVLTINATFAGNIVIDKSSSSAITTLAADMVIGGNFSIIDDGPFDTQGNAMTVNDFTLSGGTFTANASAITINGDYTRTAGTFVDGSSTVIYGGSGTQTVTSLTTTFFNVTVTNVSAGGVIFTDLLTVDGTLSLNPASGVVALTFDETAAHVIDAVNVNGTSAQALATFRSQVGGNQYDITTLADAILTFVDIQDMNLSGGNWRIDRGKDSGNNSASVKVRNRVFAA